MRADRFQLWRSRVRRAGALYDFVRVDHVVGLYRTFNFGSAPDAPGEFSPSEEGAQLAQGEEIIRALIEEAGRTELIAEDLGTVPPWVRKSLTQLGVPGYKVMQWEREDWGTPNERFVSPAKYPELSLATTGTHDTETLSEWWHGHPEVERARLVRALGIETRVQPEQPFDEAALDAILEALYAAPSRLVLIPIQDLFGWNARINWPGTIGEFNWTWRLPFTIEELRRNPLIQARAAKLRAIAERTKRFG